MKLALISAGLFFASYVVVNGGLGSQPMAVIVPLLVVIGTTLVAAKFMSRRPSRTPGEADIFVPPEFPLPPQRMASVRPSGGNARKLF